MSTLGRAVIEFSADTAKFAGDVGRTAAMFDKSMSQMTRGISGLVRSWQGIAALTASGGALALLLRDTVKTRASLDDLADTVGGNVQTLDALRRQAVISGFEFDQLSGALTKFAKNLNSTDDEGKAAAQAIRALGLDTAALAAQKPDAAMIAVAGALNKFEDGAAKAAVGVALMGKEGAKMLPYLKDLAEAGELQGKITAEQAAQAERLEKQWRLLKQSFVDTKDALAGAVIPGLLELTDQLREGERIAGSFARALMLFGTINPFRSIGGNLNELRTEIEGLEKMRERALPKGDRGALADIDAHLDASRKRLEFMKFLQQQQALKLAGPGSLDARDLMAARKPQLIFSPGAVGGNAADHSAADLARSLEAQREILDEADRLGVQFLQKEQEKITRWNEQLEEASRRGWIEHAEEVFRAAEEEARELARIAAEAEKTSDVARELGLTFSSAFEDAVIGGKKLSDVLKGIEQDIARIILRKAVTEPLAQGASGLMDQVLKGGLSAMFSGLFSGGGASAGAAGAFDAGGFSGVGAMGFASGTDYVPRDMLAVLHRGEAVVPASENSGMGGVTVVNNLHIDARSDQAQVSRLVEAGVARGLAAYQDRLYRGKTAEAMAVGRA